MLAGYEPEEVVALLSCFVFQEKTDVEPVLTPHLEEGREAILAVANRVGEVQSRNKVSAPDSESGLKFGLVEVVYEWAKGMVSRRLASSYLVSCHCFFASGLTYYLYFLSDIGAL